ncbi:MAG TPA: Hsp20/alpha crystallin family protein [Gemmatimonadales bacterium]|nr:Hsp20/alpha crystallin family protein [Gemmatimonadales bacterium]
MVYTTTLTAPAFALRRQIDRLLEDTLGHGRAGQGDWVPAVDICETEGELTFSVELAGVRPEDVEVTAEEGILTIHGARTAERSEGEDERYHLVERSYGSFLRRFQLPQGVDADKIEADVKEGVLRVRIPRMALPAPKRIQVKTRVEAVTRPAKALADESRPASPKKLNGAGRSK